MHKVALLLKASRKSLQSLRKTVYFMQFLVFSTATALLVAGIPLRLLSLAACTGFILSGLVFGLVTILGRWSIWPAALAHGINNTIGIVALYHGQ